MPQLTIITKKGLEKHLGVEVTLIGMCRDITGILLLAKDPNDSNKKRLAILRNNHKFNDKKSYSVWDDEDVYKIRNDDYIRIKSRMYEVSLK